MLSDLEHRRHNWRAAASALELKSKHKYDNLEFNFILQSGSESGEPSALAQTQDAVPATHHHPKDGGGQHGQHQPTQQAQLPGEGHHRQEAEQQYAEDGEGQHQPRVQRGHRRLHLLLREEGSCGGKRAGVPPPPSQGNL